MAVVACETFSGGDVEFPAVECAGEDTSLDLTEAGQIRFQVRAAALDAVAVALPHLPLRLLFGVEAFGILDALGGEALEEAVDVLVVPSVTFGLEAAGEEDLVDPVLVVTLDAGLDEGRVQVEAVLARLAVPGADLPPPEIENDRRLGV